VKFIFMSPSIKCIRTGGTKNEKKCKTQFEFYSWRNSAAGWRRSSSRIIRHRAELPHVFFCAIYMLVESITTARARATGTGAMAGVVLDPRRSGGSQVRYSHFVRLRQMAVKYRF